jgi:beta-carotene hydroxylase
MFNRNGILKYSIDVRPLAFVAGSLVLSLLPFFFHPPLWAFALYWPALLYMRSFCPYAQHNQAHLSAFNSPLLNGIYNVLLAQTTGYQTALWELHHNRGHHRNFLTPELDVARVQDLKTGRPVSRPWYALKGNLTIHLDAVRIGRAERAAQRKSLLGKLAAEFSIQLAITVALLICNPMAALFCFILPCLFTSWFIWWESYTHHLDVPGTSIYDGSVTVTGWFFNLTNFNIGHHTAHHEKPTLHWSLLPARTEAIRSKIHEACVRDTRGPGIRPASGAQEVVSHLSPGSSSLWNLPELS